MFFAAMHGIAPEVRLKRLFVLSGVIVLLVMPVVVRTSLPIHTGARYYAKIEKCPGQWPTIGTIVVLRPKTVSAFIQ